MTGQIKIHITEKGILPLEEKKFGGKIFNGKHLKIYVAKKGDDFLYVGKTTQTIGARFRGNFLTYKNAIRKRNGSNNYSYKWIKEFINNKKGLDLFVYKLQTGNDRVAEAVEAELVYLIRKRKGYWPQFQNEIHFHNDKKAVQMAEDIYSKLIS